MVVMLQGEEVGVGNELAVALVVADVVPLAVGVAEGEGVTCAYTKGRSRKWTEISNNKPFNISLNGADSTPLCGGRLPEPEVTCTP